MNDIGRIVPGGNTDAFLGLDQVGYASCLPLSLPCEMHH